MLDRIVEKKRMAKHKRPDKRYACGIVAIDEKERDQQERAKQRKARDLRGTQRGSQNEERRRQDGVGRGAGVPVEQANRREESRRHHDEPETVGQDEALVGQRERFDQANARRHESDNVAAALVLTRYQFKGEPRGYDPQRALEVHDQIQRVQG